MNKFQRIVRSFYKNIIIKRKFKSYWVSFTDKEYRAEIDNLYDLTKGSTGTVLILVPTDLLVHGHRIIYPEYTKMLLSRIEDKNLELEPIRVVESNGKYVVVDGNHRLPAIIARAKILNRKFTKCEVII